MTDNSSERNRSIPSQTSKPQDSKVLVSAIEQVLKRNPSDEAIERVRLAAEQFPRKVSTPIPTPKWTWSSKTMCATAACLSVIIVLVVAIKNYGPLQSQAPHIEIETVIEFEPKINPTRRSTQVTLVSTTYQRLFDDLSAAESRVNDFSESLSLAQVHRDIQDTLHEYRQWPHRRFDKNKGNPK